MCGTVTKNNQLKECLKKQSHKNKTVKRMYVLVDRNVKISIVWKYCIATLMLRWSNSSAAAKQNEIFYTYYILNLKRDARNIKIPLPAYAVQ